MFMPAQRNELAAYPGILASLPAPLLADHTQLPVHGFSLWKHTIYYPKYQGRNKYMEYKYMESTVR